MRRGAALAALVSALLVPALGAGTAHAKTLIANSGKCAPFRGLDLLNFVRVYQDAQGYSLSVAPTLAGRDFAFNGGTTGLAFAWSATVQCTPNAGGVGPYLLGKLTIRQQFECHAWFGGYRDPRNPSQWLGGPTWDLEGWRPARASTSSWIQIYPVELCGARAY